MVRCPGTAAPIALVLKNLRDEFEREHSTPCAT
jgi:hypothetical protein